MICSIISYSEDEKQKAEIVKQKIEKKEKMTAVKKEIQKLNIMKKDRYYKKYIEIQLEILYQNMFLKSMI